MHFQDYNAEWEEILQMLIKDRKLWLDSLLNRYLVKLQEYEKLKNDGRYKHKYFKIAVDCDIENIKEWIEKIEKQYSYTQLRQFAIVKMQELAGDFSSISTDDFILHPDYFSVERLENKYGWMMNLPGKDYSRLVYENDTQVILKYRSGLQKTLDEFIGLLSGHPDYSFRAPMLIEADRAFNSGFKMAAILLLTREIEGLTKDLTLEVLRNIPDPSENVLAFINNFISKKKHFSLSDFFNSIDEYPENIRDYYSPKNKSIIECIGFLALDYTQERNNMMHGEKVEFDLDVKWCELLFIVSEIAKLYTTYGIVGYQMLPGQG